MSQEDLEKWRATVDRQLAALAAGTSLEATIDIQAEIWHPEIELDLSDVRLPDLAEFYRGAEESRHFWREWFSAWETLDWKYEFVDAGDRVVLLFDMTMMRGRSTGIELPFGSFAWVGTFKDGLMIHSKVYMNQAEALEAVGLSE